jgi:hypothetical protein
MLNRFSKMMLVATSVAPTLLLMAVGYFFTGKAIPGYVNFGMR